MKNFRINTGNEQPEPKHGYYEVGTKLVFTRAVASESQVITVRRAGV